MPFQRIVGVAFLFYPLPWRPIRIFIPIAEIFRFPFRKRERLFYDRISTLQDLLLLQPLSRESQIIAFPNGFPIHLLIGDAILHTSHGGNQTGGTFQIPTPQRTGHVLISTQSAEHDHRADISIGIILRRRRPPGNDVSQGISLPLPTESEAIRVQYLPCCPIAIRHRCELHKTFISLLYPCPFPLVGRMADIKRVIVS